MKTVPISERALLARINRKLKPDYEALRRAREDSCGFNELGRYFLLDLYRNAVVEMHVDLEMKGRELGVLRDYETLSEEGA